MKIYGIKNCNTVKKALQWLDDNGLAYEFHDLKKMGIHEERLAAWEKVYAWEELLNKRGTTWRMLPDAEKDAVVDQASANRLMIEKTSIIKRPVIEAGEVLLLGFDAGQYENKLK